MRSLKLNIIFLLLSFTTIYSDSLIDSLKVELEHSSGVKRVETLLRLGERYSFLNFNQSIRYFLEANNLSKKVDDRGSEYSSLSSIAKLYSFKGEYKKALINQEKAIKLKMRFLPNDNLSKDYLDYGNILRYLQRYDEAIDTYYKGLGEPVVTHKKSLFYNLGLAYRSSGSFTKAIAAYDSSLSYNNPKDLRFKSMIYNNLGDVYELMGSYNKALDYFNRSLDINQSNSFTPSLYTNYINLGSVHKSLGDYESSRLFLSKGLEIAGNDPYRLKIVYLNLYGLYNLKGDSKEAMNFYQKFVEMDQKVRQSIHNNSLEKVEQQYTQEKIFSDKQIAIEKERTRSRWIVIISVLTIIIAILISLVLLSRSRIKAKKLELERKHSELKSLQSRNQSTLPF